MGAGRRLPLLATTLVACAASLLCPTVARAAATLDLSVDPTATVGETIAGTVSGTVDVQSYIDVYIHDGDDACAPTSAEQDARADSAYVATAWAAAGPYSYASDVPAEYAGVFRVCAYLYEAPTGAFRDDELPDVLRDALVTVSEPDGDGEGVPDSEDNGSGPGATAPPPTPPSPPPAITVPSGPAADTQAPSVGLTVSRQRLGVALTRGIALRVRLSEVGGACAQLALSVRVARRLGLIPTSAERRNRAVILGRRCATFPTAATRTLTVRFTARAARALRRLARARKGLSLTITVVGKDSAGNQRALSRPLALGR